MVQTAICIAERGVFHRPEIAPLFQSASLCPGCHQRRKTGECFMKTDASHHVGKRRMSKISDEHPLARNK
jgi:hypothetical protein